MQFDLDVPYALYVEAACGGVEAPARAVGPLHRIPAPLTPEPGKALVLTPSAPTVKTPEGMVETGKGSPAHRDPPYESVWPYRS
jgi:hypothetical protein